MTTRKKGQVKVAVQISGPCLDQPLEMHQERCTGHPQGQVPPNTRVPGTRMLALFSKTKLSSRTPFGGGFACIFNAPKSPLEPVFPGLNK